MATAGVTMGVHRVAMDGHKLDFKSIEFRGLFGVSSAFFLLFWIILKFAQIMFDPWKNSCGCWLVLFFYEDL